MQWINQDALVRWANRIGSREQFPVMVRDLILASARDLGDILYIRFPGGESGQIRGYDGDLTMAVRIHMIPVGRSIWEFGTGKNPVAKFKADYKTRVKDICKDLTFVFVTPRNWDDPSLKLPIFLQEYKDKGDFADVLYIDGAMLETWLEEHGAVGAKHARLVLDTMPDHGARSTDEFWEEFSSRYNPKLTEEVVLAARTEQAQQIVDHLMSSRGQLVFVGDGPEEVSAVAVAAIRQAEGPHRQFLEARTLIVDNDVAGRLLSKADRYGYILSPTVKEVGGSLANYCPTVSALDYRPFGNSFTHLHRPSIREMSHALATMGYSNEQSETLARKSGRSLTILLRHANSGGFNPPSWIEHGDQLIPALLAGAWSTQQAGDLEILAELSGLQYAEYEQKLRDYLIRQDAPIDLRGGLWRLRAPVDVFVNLSHLVTDRHLNSLADATNKVFETVASPDVSDEYYDISPYSSLLREGIATTLLIIAAMHEEVGIKVGLDPETFVNNLVAGLPGLYDDVRVILGLEEHLTYLMEAAPCPLLSALEQMLEGDEAGKVLFSETSQFGFAHSNLPNLLRALELQAWDPLYFRRAALLLAKLASLDTGGKSRNLPISSLRDILTAWLPGTNAPFVERIAVIDEIISLHPQVAWQLVTMLLPDVPRTKNSTQTPRYQDAGASNCEVLTNGIIAETYDALTDRALTLIEEIPAHWVELVEVFPSFLPERRKQFLEMLAPFAQTIDGEERVELRRKLRMLVDRHARFRQAEWALPDEERGRLQDIVKSLESDDLFDQARALFDEMDPYTAEDFAAAERAIEQRRANAIANLAATFGASAIIRLSGVVRNGTDVAYAAAKGITDPAVLKDLLSAGAPNLPAPELSTALAGMLRRKGGDSYDTQILVLAKEAEWDSVRIASMLLNWPEEPRTWSLIATLGEDGQQHFWANRRPIRFDGPVSELEELVKYFVTAGRAYAALIVVHPREEELSWEAVITILPTQVDEVNASRSNETYDYLIGKLFKSLRGRDDVDQLELARLEYVYYPILEHKNEDLALYERMALEPEFYVSIMKDVFVADDVDAADQLSTPEQRNRSSISHRILGQNKRVPGENDGVGNQQLLDAWIDGMLAESHKQKLTKIVPSYIGRTLAHASEVDGIWPPLEVATTIERLQSEDIERSIVIERRNMRGVYIKLMFEGGDQERELAERYRKWAAASIKFPRTRSMLTVISEACKKDAKHADDEAERDQFRFE